MKSSLDTEISAYTLFTIPANRSQQRFAFIVGAIIALITLMSVPFAQISLPKSNTFLPVLLGAMVCFELITVFVLYNQFRVSRSPKILILCAGYMYSALMTLAYMLTFPGFFPPDFYRPGNQTAEYLYAFWHAGFPLAILAYTAMSKFEHVRLSRRQSLWGTIFGSLGVMGTVVLIVHGSIAYERKLPFLMEFGYVTPFFTYGFALPILLLSIAALVCYYRQTRGNTVTSTWLCVALFATMLDVGILLCGGNRFSLGWYVSKLDSFIFANIVLAGMIYEFTKMYVKMTNLYDESRQAQRTIAEKNKIIERMLTSSDEAITMCDSSGMIVFANGRFEELFGRALPVGESLASYCEGMKLFNGGSLDDLIRMYFERRQPAFREMVSLNEVLDEIGYYECYVNPIASEDGNSLYGHLFAFGNRTEAVRKAHFDELTGLPNRRYVQEWLERRASQQESNDLEPYGLLFLDLDGFKQVNDTHGHEIGDRLLQEVAAVLNRCMNDQSIGARWAGDEFVIMVEHVEHTIQLEKIADSVISAVRQIKDIDGLPIRISGSIGIAIVPTDGFEATTLLQHADEAMYKAKSSGKNRYCFYGKIA